MTLIDPLTNCFETAKVNTKCGGEAQHVFDSTWLAGYPRPNEIGYNNEGEFKFLLCENVGIKSRPTNEYNAQSNARIEHAHQVLGNQLRFFELENRILTKEEGTFEPFLTACAYALHCTYHTTLQAS